MSELNKHEKYQALAINTMTPGELIVLLFEEGILCIHRSVFYIRNKNVADAHKNIIKAQNIVLYLIDILDINYPLSDKLLKLYDFIYMQLIKANAEKDEQLLNDIAGFFKQLKETWQQAEISNRENSILRSTGS